MSSMISFICLIEDLVYWRLVYWQSHPYVHQWLHHMVDLLHPRHPKHPRNTRPSKHYSTNCIMTIRSLLMALLFSMTLLRDHTSMVILRCRFGVNCIDENPTNPINSPFFVTVRLCRSAVTLRPKTKEALQGKDPLDFRVGVSIKNQKPSCGRRHLDHKWLQLRALHSPPLLAMTGIIEMIPVVWRPNLN